MAEPRVQWVTASPLWDGAVSVPERIRRPALLAFGSDSFMEDLAALLDAAPEQLADHVAIPKSHQAPPRGASSSWQPPAPANVKLYQPVHGHFSLVAATLVCRMTGLPDHRVDTARAERVGFVLRRTNAGGEEWAWIDDAVQGIKGWQPIASGQEITVAAHEERLPLFPVNFDEDDRRRRLLLGLIPTASIETLATAPALPPAAGAPAGDPRLDLVDERIIEQLKALQNPLGKTPPPSDAQAHEASLFILLDLAELLATMVLTTWPAILETPTPARPPDPSAGLYDLLSATAVGGDTALAALRAVWKQRDRIVLDGTTEPALSYDLRDWALNQDATRSTLQSAITAALGSPPAATDQPSETVAVARLEGPPGTLYVTRCVYEQPRCKPFHGALVSEPSTPFEIAGFFDPDAPSRPIVISMPEDTSIAGLRKFKNNVAFRVSAKLRDQLGCGGHALSFSIPIITLCAMIVLMIFLVLLNIVFWWLPFLRICVPGNVKIE